MSMSDKSQDKNKRKDLTDKNSDLKQMMMSQSLSGNPYMQQQQSSGGYRVPSPTTSGNIIVNPIT